MKIHQGVQRYAEVHLVDLYRLSLPTQYLQRLDQQQQNLHRINVYKLDLQRLDPHKIDLHRIDLCRVDLQTKST